MEQDEQLLPRDRQSFRGKFIQTLGLDDPAVKILFFLATLITVVTILFSSTVIYAMAFHDNPPMVWNELDWVADTVVVDEDGGTAYIHSSFCKYTSASHRVVGTWLNGLEIGARLIPNRSVDPGCYEHIVPINVPPELPSGEYYLELQAIYQINHLKERRVTRRTDTAITINNLTGYQD